MNAQLRCACSEPCMWRRNTVTAVSKLADRRVTAAMFVRPCRGSGVFPSHTRTGWAAQKRASRRAPGPSLARHRPWRESLVAQKDAACPCRQDSGSSALDHGRDGPIRGSVIGLCPQRLESRVTGTSGLPAPRPGTLAYVTSSTTIEPISERLSSASWWFRSSEGRLTLWQWPNPALCVWLMTLVLGWLDLSATHATAVDGIRHGALLVWSLDEVVRGASPFRRVLGAVILAVQIATLVLG